MANNPKPLPGKVVSALLDKLGSDDAFRDLFQSNPAEALRQVGAPEPEDCARCLKIKKLADKKTIKAASDELKTHLAGTLSLQVPQLIAR
jgi:putative modified peptide